MVTLALQLKFLLLRLSQASNQANSRESLLLVTLKYFIRDHVTSCHQVLAINQEMLANLILGFFLSIIPVNISLVTRLIFVQLSPVEKFATIVLICNQLFNAFIFLLPLARLSARIHHCSKCLVSVQLSTPNRLLHLKLQIDSIFGRLVDGNQIYGLTIGPMATVTYKSIINILFIYSACFFFILNFVYSNRVRQMYGELDHYLSE